jgi:hypothetical protein
MESGRALKGRILSEFFPGIILDDFMENLTRIYHILWKFFFSNFGIALIFQISTILPFSFGK